MYPMYPLLFGLILGGIADAKAPEWAKKNTQSLSGNFLKTVCSGTGPSLDSARREALDSCRISARDQLTTNIKVKSLVVQTEKSVGFHEEITGSTSYSGLDCIPFRDDVEELDGAYKIWLECKFDLSKVKITPIEETEKIAKESEDSISNREELSVLAGSPAPSGRYFSGTQTTLAISSVPKCESVIILGRKSRTVTCDENPLTIVIDAEDKEILVRAKGYAPKKILLGKERKSHEAIQVTLDLL